MTLNEYQEETKRTCLPEPGFELSSAEIMLSWNALGLAGEAGEFADLVKKGVYHQHGLDLAHLKKELGDVLWYVSALATGFGWTLEEVGAENIAKLYKRYPEGYSAKASQERGGDTK